MEQITTYPTITDIITNFNNGQYIILFVGGYIEFNLVDDEWNIGFHEGLEEDKDPFRYYPSGVYWSTTCKDLIHAVEVCKLAIQDGIVKRALIRYKPDNHAQINLYGDEVLKFILDHQLYAEYDGHATLRSNKGQVDTYHYIDLSTGEIVNERSFEVMSFG